jgi:hypothetical protein
VPVTTPSNEAEKPLGLAAYALAILAFIPGMGILLGLPSIGWGLLFASKGGRKVATVAATGVTLNILGYAIIFYLGFAKQGIFKSLEGQMTHDHLHQAMLEIEYWRLQHGQYPDSLAQLLATPADARLAPLYDHTVSLRGTRAPYFYYERAPDGSHYWLRARGPDETPFTQDDIVPQVPDSERARSGLLLER